MEEEFIHPIVGDESGAKGAGKTDQGIGQTRVGRWMSQAEYDKMVKTSQVQMSGDNKVHVANPANVDAFDKQAPIGSIYVEFDVPSNTISPGGTDGWGIIHGPGSDYMLKKDYRQYKKCLKPQI